MLDANLLPEMTLVDLQIDTQEKFGKPSSLGAAKALQAHSKASK